MAISINFDTGYLTREESTGLSALLDAIHGTLPTAEERRERLNSTTALAGGALAQSSERGREALTATDTGTLAEATPAMTATEAAQTADEPEQPAAAANDDLDTRPVGSAPEGKSRRTKAEIGYDAGLEAIAEKAGVPIEKVNEVIAQHGRKVAEAELRKIADTHIGATEAQAISTGEERVSPDDAPETEEQDKADEKAEVEAAPAKDLTADDLRAAMSVYVQKHGMANAQADGAAIFNNALGSLGDGEFWSISKVAAAGQEKLKAAIGAWNKAGAADARYGA